MQVRAVLPQIARRAESHFLDKRGNAFKLSDSALIRNLLRYSAVGQFEKETLGGAGDEQSEDPECATSNLSGSSAKLRPRPPMTFLQKVSLPAIPAGSLLCKDLAAKTLFEELHKWW